MNKTLWKDTDETDLFSGTITVTDSQGEYIFMPAKHIDKNGTVRYREVLFLAATNCPSETKKQTRFEDNGVRPDV